MPSNDEINKINNKLNQIESVIEKLTKRINTYQLYNKEKLVSIFQEAFNSNERDKKLSIIINLIITAIVLAIFGIASLWFLAE